MAIIRKLVAQDDNDDNQWLKVDHDSRYIENDMDDWQFLFGPNSVLSTSSQIIKIAARLNDQTFNNIQVTAYLYDQKTGSISNAASCVFNIYKVTVPTWNDTFITTINGVQQPNQYFYVNPTIASLGIDLIGGDTLMIEGVIVRLGVTYRDRIYVNHLGIYNSVIKLKQDVEWLDITKLDE